jgi:hypothetical protein
MTGRERSSRAAQAFRAGVLTALQEGQKPAGDATA